MSDYSRLTSYIYSYEKGVKSKNAGFARVETRGQLCKINISLRIHDILMNETDDNMLEVFLFTRKNGKVYKSSIGRIRIVSGNSIFRTQFHPDEIGDAALKLDEIAGIFICSKVFLNGNSTIREVYASEWDDTTIYVDEFENSSQEDEEDFAIGNVVETQRDIAAAEIEYVAEADNRNYRVNDNRNSSEIENADMITFSNAMNGINSAKVYPAVTDGDRETEETDILVEENHVTGEMDTTEKESIVTGEADTVVKENNIAGEADMPAKENDMDEAAPIPENMKKYEKELQELLEKSDNKVERPRVPDNSDYFRMLSNCYPKIKIEGLGDCIKISPHDISYLPRKYWHLCNNNFLLNGYYNFRYILLCEEHEEEYTENNNTQNSIQNNTQLRYMICVPGFLRNRERNMAKMYGFNRFKEKKQSDRAEFGYWCMYL